MIKLFTNDGGKKWEEVVEAQAIAVVDLAVDVPQEVSLVVEDQVEVFQEEEVFQEVLAIDHGPGMPPPRHHWGGPMFINRRPYGTGCGCGGGISMIILIFILLVFSGFFERMFYAKWMFCYE